MKLAPLLIVLALVGCSRGTADRVVAVDVGDPRMETAIQEARATTDEFIAALHSDDPANTGFSVKVPIRDGDEVEHFWIVDVTYRDGEFSGFIGNEPQWVSTVQEGQRYATKETEISDWMYIRNGTAIGNRTLRAMFPHMPDEEVAAVKRQLGWE